MISRFVAFACPGRLWLAGCVVCVATLGCQRHIVPISGRVTLNKKPLAGAVVTFQPLPEPRSPRPPATGSVGRTDDEGKFSLRLIDPDSPGAAIGEHTVTISTATGGSDTTPAKGQPLPKVWMDGSKRFRVPAGGTTEANFDISGP
jgi:hypothetical protein